MENDKKFNGLKRVGAILAIAFFALLAIPVLASAFAGDTAEAGVVSGADSGDDEPEQSRHDCWDETLADTESGSEEINAIIDAFNNCGVPFGLPFDLSAIFDGDWFGLDRSVFFEDGFDVDDYDFEDFPFDEIDFDDIDFDDIDFDEIEDWQLWEDLGWND